MRARVSVGFFVLGVLLFTMDPISGQPGGGKGGKGGFGGFGQGGGFPQGGGGFPQGGGGFPQGGGGFPQGGGGFRMQIQPGGGGFPQGGGGFPQGGGGFPQGGGGFQGGGGGFQGGGGFPQGGGGGGRRSPFDPESQWATLLQQSGGTDYVDFSRISPDTRAMSKMFADRMGTQPYPESGVMTKDQFLDFAARNQELARAKMGGGQPGGQQGFGQQGFGQQGFGQQGFQMQPGGFGGQGFGGKGGSSEEEIERRFKAGDRDGDGKLSPEEASERTRSMWNEYDTNRDGFVSLDEYKSLQLRLAGGGGNNGQPQYGSDFRGTGEGGGYGGPGGRREEKKDDFSNVGIRYGKLPPGLPDWFAEYDQDKDGQINMYEWRTVGGKTVAEFRELDANEDGFIAPLELIRVTATKAEVERLIAIQNGETPEGGSGRSKGGSMSGGGKGGLSGFGGGPPTTGKGGGQDARPSREEKNAEKADRSTAGPWGNGGKKGK
ncbi:MAG: hypothetical protein U0804_02335 [Gemmataceae bacterium]